MSVDEIIEMWTDEYRDEITKKVNDIVLKLEAGDKPYYQSTKSFEDMVDHIQQVHGDETNEELYSLMRA